MDYTEFTAIKNRLSGSPNLCDLFKLLSIETWKRMEYTYIKPRVKVFETTLTQNLIFTLNAYADQYGLNIEIFEAKDERTNGNDFELIIRYPSEKLEYYAPIQAKKVYRNGKYVSMDHGDQILSLIDYAKLNKARPFYLLYNYDAILAKKPDVPELLGCTLISADYLYKNYYNKRVSTDMFGMKSNKWMIPEFKNLNPKPAFAWHDLVCKDNVSDLMQLFSDNDILPKRFLPTGTEISNMNDANSGLFPINTLRDEDNWVNLKNLTPKLFDEQKAFELKYAPHDFAAQIEKFVNQENNNRKEKTFPEFAPQSRIVITKE